MPHIQKPFDNTTVPEFKKGIQEPVYQKLYGELPKEFGDAEFFKFCDDMGITSRDKFVSFNYVRGASKKALAAAVSVSMDTIKNNIKFVSNSLKTFVERAPKLLLDKEDPQFWSQPWHSAFSYDDLKTVSRRTLFSLHVNGVHSLQDLATAIKDGPKSLENFGATSRREITDLLARNNIEFETNKKSPKP